MKLEVWKSIPFDDAYAVSSLGRVASKEREVPCGPGGGKRRIPRRILKPFLSKSTGYLQVNLTKHDRHSVHSLVARAFLSCADDSMVVNHKNGTRTDNRLCNLEWVTHSENHLHSYRELNRKGSSEGKFSADHPTSKAVIRTCLASGEKRVYLAAIDAVKEGGFDSGSISKCCSGKQESHKGYRWSFADQEASA